MEPSQACANRSPYEALQHEARFQKLLSLVPGIIYQFRRRADGSVCFPFISGGCRQVFEFEPEVLRQDAMPLIECIHPEDRFEFDRAVTASAITLQPWQLQGRFILPSGQLKWIEGSSRPETELDGSILWDGYLIDITASKQLEIELQQAKTELENRVEERNRELRERKVAQLALQASEERFRSLIEATSQIIWDAKAEGVFVTEQPQWSAFTGQTFDELKGWGWLNAIHPDDQPHTNKVWSAAVANSTLCEVEYRLRRYDGEYRYMNVRAVPILDSDGSVREWIGVHTDISDRKAAETALQQKEAQYRSIFESVSDGIAIYDLDLGNVLACNPAYIRMNGYTAEEFKQIHPSSYIHPDSLHLFPNLLETVRAGKKFFCEAKNIRKDGTAFDVEVAGIPHLYNDKPCVLAVIRDVSDRKAAETALQQKEAQYRSIFESVSDGIVIYDLDTGNVLACNPAFTEMNGYTVEEFIQLPKESYIHPDYLHLFSSLVETVRAGKQFFCEAKNIRKNGTAFDTEVTGISHFYKDKACVLAVVRDVSDRKQAEEALRQSEAQLRQKATDIENTLKELQKTQSQLVQSEKMSSLGQLVAGVAHEINNPVNFIYGNLTHANDYTQDLLGLVELYQQHYPNPVVAVQQEIEAIDLEFLMEDLPKLFASMRVGADRIQKIVLSLRNFSRMDEAELKEVNIHEGIDSTLMILQNRIKSKPEHPGIKVIKEYGNIPAVECYAGQLNQVFMNILSNALDALEEGDKERSLSEIKTSPSQIRIWTGRVEPDRVAIRIEDNGVGMPENVRSRIFDPFFTTKPVGKGTGLGLPISYQVVTERHAGQLWCESQVGQGTMFIIELPVYQTKPSKPSL